MKKNFPLALIALITFVLVFGRWEFIIIFKIFGKS